VGEENDSRPSGLSFIGWLWLIAGGLMALLALAGLLLAAPLERAMGSLCHLMRGTLAAEVNGVLARHWVSFGALHLGVALVSALGGGGLLGLRTWGRLTVELLCWLSLLYTVAAGAYLLLSFSAVMGELFRGESGFQSTLGLLVGGLVTLILTVALMIPLWLMLRYLRSRAVRAACGC
jgi:hypothetical protein